MRRVLGFLMVAMLAMGAHGASLSVASSNATLVTATGARLNAAVLDVGTGNPNGWFCWGTSTNGGTNLSSWAGVTNLGECVAGRVYTNVTGLASNTTYYFRLYASNDTETAWASISSFKTLKTVSGTDVEFDPEETEPEVPVVSAAINSANATLVTGGSAKLNAYLVNDWATNPVCWFYYGTADGGTNAGTWQYSTNAGNQTTGAVSAVVTGLTVSTAYYFRMSATNGTNVAWGDVETFTTLPVMDGSVAVVAVELGISNATLVTASSATLNGAVVNPGDTNPVCTYYYGKADAGSVFTNWGYSTNVGQQGLGRVGAAITGLDSNTVYYYRLYATNYSDTAWSGLSSFRTIPSPVTDLGGIISNATHLVGVPGDRFIQKGGLSGQMWLSDGAGEGSWGTPAGGGDVIQSELVAATNGVYQRASNDWAAADAAVMLMLSNALVSAWRADDAALSNWVSGIVATNVGAGDTNLWAMSNGVWVTFSPGAGSGIESDPWFTNWAATSGWATVTITNDLYPRNNPSNWVTESITNGLASEAWVTAQGYVTQSITNGLWRLEDGTNWVANVWWPSIDASAIAATDIANWDTAWGWGDHAGLYDLLGSAAAASNGVVAQLVSSNWVNDLWATSNNVFTGESNVIGNVYIGGGRMGVGILQGAGYKFGVGGDTGTEVYFLVQATNAAGVAGCEFKNATQRWQLKTGSSHQLTFRDSTAGSNVWEVMPGSAQYSWRILTNETVFNDGGVDRNFRVESDTRANALFLKGATGYLGLNDSTPSYGLDVNENAQVQSNLYVLGTGTFNSVDVTNLTLRGTLNTGGNWISGSGGASGLNVSASDSVSIEDGKGWYKTDLNGQTVVMTSNTNRTYTGGQMALRIGGGSLASPTAASNNYGNALMLMQLHDGITWRNAAYIYGISTADCSASNTPADLIFYTNPGGATISAVERMRVKSNGAVRFSGGSSFPTGAAGDIYYHTVSNKHFGHNGSTWNALY